LIAVFQLEWTIRNEIPTLLLILGCVKLDASHLFPFSMIVTYDAFLDENWKIRFNLLFFQSTVVRNRAFFFLAGE
jgi:hypothetical protein